MHNFEIHTVLLLKVLEKAWEGFLSSFEISKFVMCWKWSVEHNVDVPHDSTHLFS